MLQDNILQSFPCGLNTLGFVFPSNNLSWQQNTDNMGNIIEETLSILNRWQRPAEKFGGRGSCSATWGGLW